MLSPEAITLLETRYLRENETPERMFQRVADHVAQAEGIYGGNTKEVAEEYYKIMSDLTFLPNSPTLMNAGRPNAQLAACFVLPVYDSPDAILETLQHMEKIHYSGGGTGFSFSRLAPRDERVGSDNSTAAGPLPVIQTFNKAAEKFKQNAVRSGANMAVLRVDHPDVLHFINGKRRNDVLNNFNLSVGITNQFMMAAVNNTEYHLIHPHSGAITDILSARDVFDSIVDAAWANGEPGLFFLDTVNKANPTPQLGEIEAPNPCSEQPLLPYESCTLGSINLKKVILEKSGRMRCIDFERLRKVVRVAVRFLDSVIDVNCYPVDVIAQISRRTRKIGLGIMGLADIFIMLDIPYASRQAVELTETIMRFITAEARRMSVELAVQRGSFPAFRDSIYSNQDISQLRNAAVTTIAPTGSISIIAGCSSGIEPLFALSMTRRVLGGRLLTTCNDTVLTYLEEQGLLNSEIDGLIKQQGTVQGAGMPTHVEKVLATAHEIMPVWHVSQLIAAQKFTDNGVSKTVNMPKYATRRDVSEVFIQAYRGGCKGITVYRDQSRRQQVLIHGIDCSSCEL